MHRFFVLLAGESIGSTDLEYSDAGMGVAYGSFYPTSAYQQIRGQIVLAAELRQRNEAQRAPEPALQITTSANEIVNSGFVVIDDFTEPAVDPEITVQFANREQFERLIMAGLTPRRS